MRKRSDLTSVLMLSAIAFFSLAGCGGGGGGGGTDDDAPLAPGGSDIGADGVPIFWQVFGHNVAFGRLHAVSETADGGYVAAGFQSVDNGPNDLYVVKVDCAGATQWERRIPIDGSAIAYAVCPLAAGGYMVAGTSGDGPTARAVMVQLDGAGAPLAGWPKTFGDAGTAAYGMLAVNGGAGGFMLTGVSGPNLYVLRVDVAGRVLWSKTNYASFCPGGGAVGAAIAATTGGDYVIAGRTGCSFWAGFLMKIERNTGAEIWRQMFDDDEPANYAGLDAVIETPEGDLLACGRTGPNCFVGERSGRCDAVVVKTGADGKPQWSRRYGGGEIDSACGAAIAADGNYVVAGTTRSYGGDIKDPSAAFMWDDLMLIKITPDGGTIWHKVKGVRPRAIDNALALAAVSDGGFIVAGEAGGNGLLAKFDKNGDTVYLGDSYDLTIAVVTQGVINFKNAVDVAGIGATGFIMPRQIGAPLLDLLIAASRGEPPADFCNGGGAYGFDPVVPDPLVAGGSYTLTVSNCMSGPADSRLLIDGSGTLTVDAVSGAPGGAGYSLQVTVRNLALTVTEIGSAPLLTQTFAGGLRIARTVNAGNRSEVAGMPAGETLAVTERSGGVTTLAASYGPLSVHYTLSAGLPLAVGQAGDEVTASSEGQAYVAGVLQPLQLSPATLEAIDGSYRVTAQDASRLTATLFPSADGGSALLAIDTNGDGTDDGSLSVPWDFIY
ncbi:MAG TPA: hypothetical protein DCM87_12055 [Planctomycetes bacterium]|nr:hypothetical protein [Planctomycetota bacterium]